MAKEVPNIYSQTKSTSRPLFMNTNLLTLSLFSSVIKKESSKPHLNYDFGILIPSGGLHAKADILQYANEKRLSGEDLNKTFHKSWKIIQDSTRFELFVHQVTHYLSTYGSEFKDTIYLPTEELELPELELPITVINVITEKEAIDKCLQLLSSGIALKEDTLVQILDLLDSLGHKISCVDDIRNKEALVYIADRYSVYPTNPTEFLRYVVFKSTQSSLLIKDPTTLKTIKESSFNPDKLFKTFGLKKLSSVFNRFKPIFLSYKPKCPATINKISKLSKKNHKPLTANPLNLVTSELLTDTSCLEKATLYHLFKALNACYSRESGQTVFTYRVRNGKSFTKPNSSNTSVCNKNYAIILDYLKNNLPKNKTVYIPDNVRYALPTSEKMFVGNIPTGSQISLQTLNVGVYWENSWGARDLDLSALNLEGRKIGWNAAYKHDQVYYSGDITSAPNGAVEFLRVNNPQSQYIVNLNVYSGAPTSSYKIVLGEGPSVDCSFMMDPSKVEFETKCITPQRQTAVGLIHSENDKSVFTFLNFGSGGLNVSYGTSQVHILRIQALWHQVYNSLYLNDLVQELGWKTAPQNEADYDLSLNNLTKDTFLNLFS